jgi:RNA polymerase sigma-70 factor (ECF subfamily)
MSALLRAFREAADLPVVSAAAHDRAALDQLLASFYGRGRKAYPRVVVSEQTFGHHVARISTDPSPEALAKIAAEDLYLACACVCRARGAATAFERKFGPVIRRAVARVLAAVDDRQEAEQRAWHHIFIEDGDRPPRIAQYSGQGPLESWVAVASMRVASSFRRAEDVEQRLRSKVVADTVAVNAERLSMKGELRPAFEEAVAEALGRLKPRERLIVKLYVVSGMRLEAISKSLGVTRQAVSKVFHRSREAILSDVERSLKQRLGLSKEELSSVMRVVASRLDLSISRVLGNA